MERKVRKGKNEEKFVEGKKHCKEKREQERR